MNERCCLPSLNSGRGRGWGRELTFFNTFIMRPYKKLVLCTGGRYAGSGKRRRSSSVSATCAAAVVTALVGG